MSPQANQARDQAVPLGFGGEHKRSSGISYSLLGIGAALSLHENEDEVSNFIASAGIY